mmetsp:Transcript_29942/g.78939  ORF Transcript_29942/g.78939 Transcript_29942/m.78939 type:complete len:278 (-) Transcript_29942:69-902(-)
MRLHQQVAEVGLGRLENLRGGRRLREQDPGQPADARGAAPSLRRAPGNRRWRRPHALLQVSSAHRHARAPREAPADVGPVGSAALPCELLQWQVCAGRAVLTWTSTSRPCKLIMVVDLLMRQQASGLRAEARQLQSRAQRPIAAAIADVARGQSEALCPGKLPLTCRADGRPQSPELTLRNSRQLAGALQAALQDALDLRLLFHLLLQLCPLLLGLKQATPRLRYDLLLFSKLVLRDTDLPPRFPELFSAGVDLLLELRVGLPQGLHRGPRISELEL